MNQILIGVVTCERDGAWLAACQDTWLRDVNPSLMDVVIVGADFLPEGIKDTSRSPHEVERQAARDYLPHKTKALAKYAFERGYRTVVKVDNDTYLRPRNMVIPEAEYAGRLRGPSGPEEVTASTVQDTGRKIVANDCDYCSGGIYFLRKRSIQIIAEALLTNDPAEDRWVANSLIGFGIRATHVQGYFAATNRTGLPTDYLRNPATIAVMNIFEPQHMRDVYAGNFPKRHAAGSRPEDYPVGSQMRGQMR